MLKHDSNQKVESLLSDQKNLDVNKPSDIPNDVVVKPGKEGLRFGPVVTGHVALGKDGCGY
ncbi:MAG: hypothetical protein Q7R89_01150 [bacterium]|nr:hypothetical protein [bacterium]